MSTQTVRGTIGGMGRQANPAFVVAVILLPLAALGYAVTVSSIQGHIYVHVMSGVLWTGIDIFMGAVLGPVVGGLDDEESAAVFQRLTPKMAFLLPSLALVTIAAGLTSSTRLQPCGSSRWGSGISATPHGGNFLLRRPSDTLVCVLLVGTVSAW